MLEEREQNLHFIGEYHLDVIPLDSDLLSLQLPQSFKVSFAVHTNTYGITHTVVPIFVYRILLL